MLNPTKLVTLILIGFTVFTASPVSAQNQSEVGAVREAVKAYLHGGTYGDMESFHRAFYPEVKVMYVKDGEYEAWTLSEYLNLYTPGEKLDRETSILNIDVTGNAASAEVEAVYETHRFVDYLSLLKIDGTWQIVSKIFHREDF